MTVKFSYVSFSVPVKLITYPGPGPLADEIANLDIGNIANETERAKTIEFSSAYCNIQATYLVPPGSSIQSIPDVDRAGVRIVTKVSIYSSVLQEHFIKVFDGCSKIFIFECFKLGSKCLRSLANREYSSRGHSQVQDG